MLNDDHYIRKYEDWFVPPTAHVGGGAAWPMYGEPAKRFGSVVVPVGLRSQATHDAAKQVIALGNTLVDQVVYRRQCFEEEGAAHS
jgi:hypothetical protein